MKELSLHTHYVLAFWITLILAIGLFVGGFFAPPMGEISGSVLTAVGILFFWPALGFGAKAMSEGKRATIKKGDTIIEVGENNK